MLPRLPMNCPNCDEYLVSYITYLSENYSICHCPNCSHNLGEPKPVSNQTHFEQTLNLIASNDVRTLVKKDAEYGSSWKKRGGVGAFMMLARKWDRLETQVTRSGLDTKYDIFDAIGQDDKELANHLEVHDVVPYNFEATLETIRDLRRYLLLVESEIILRKEVDRGGTRPQVFANDTLKPIPQIPTADSEYAHPFPAAPSQDRTRKS